MSKKIGMTVLIWFGVIFAYIIMAAAMPAFSGLVDSTSAALQATSNMSNYPGLLSGIQASPVYVWFIPGGVGIVGSVVVLKTSLLDQ